jgi:HAD superfamily phosphoserine phosphatase-like hydrolase
MKFEAVFFDCDGVLIFSNPFVQLNTAVGISLQQDQEWVNEYYAGKITYQQWTENLESSYRKANLTREWFQKIIDAKQLAVNQEAQELLPYLHINGVKTAIISSGIGHYVGKVAEILQIPQWRCNALFHFDAQGRFERIEYVADDPEAKVIQAKQLCQQYGVDPEQVIFVGDAANDLMAFELTKHGLLYRTENPEYESKAWKRITNLLEIKEILNS